MGIKTYRRSVTRRITGVCRSVTHARRLHDIVIMRDDCEFEEMTDDGKAITFIHYYHGICGNMPSDWPRFHRALELASSAHVEWTIHYKRVGEVARDFVELVEKVIHSKQKPVVVIEGSAKWPAGPIVKQLRAMGLSVSTSPG